LVDVVGASARFNPRVSKERHMRTKLCLLLVLAALCGCASIRTDQLNVTHREFDRAMRWSDFQTAFAITRQPVANAPDFERLQHIRVTSYEEKGAGLANADGTQYVRALEIRYVNVNRMADRVLMDRQVWEFVEKENHWKLTSPFPSFLP
jgi:hypothetical protein